VQIESQQVPFTNWLVWTQTYYACEQEVIYTEFKEILCWGWDVQGGPDAQGHVTSKPLGTSSFGSPLPAETSRLTVPSAVTGFVQKAAKYSV